MRHTLTNIDLEQRKADCSVCGQVSLHIGSQGRRQCYYAHKYGSSYSPARLKTKTCEICGIKEKVFFDHCHDELRHRGWLCRKCNILLGFANNDVAVLQKAIAYLNNFRVQ